MYRECQLDHVAKSAVFQTLVLLLLIRDFSDSNTCFYDHKSGDNIQRSVELNSNENARD